MSEPGMNFEQPKITDEQVIEVLKNRRTDPEAMMVLQNWSEAQNRIIDDIVANQGEVEAEVPILSQNIDRVELYLSAGLVTEAFEEIDFIVGCIGKDHKFDQVAARAAELKEKIHQLGAS